MAVAVPLVSDCSQAVGIGEVIGCREGLSDLRGSRNGDGSGCRIIGIIKGDREVSFNRCIVLVPYLYADGKI